MILSGFVFSCLFTCRVLKQVFDMHIDRRKNHLDEVSTCTLSCMYIKVKISFANSLACYYFLLFQINSKKNTFL